MTKRKIDQLVAQWRGMGPVAWAEHAYGWIGPDGRPITLSDWQRAALSAWWDRRADVSTLAISNVKKTGKTFLNAVLTAWRWLALPGEHYCAGNDLDQSAGRQFKEVAAMVQRHPLLAEYVRATRNLLTFEAVLSTLEALAVDATGNAGSNHLTVSHTEAWGIQYEGAIRAYEELTPPPGAAWGFPALRIVDSYAGWLGESDTWHKLVDRGLAGERLPGDWPLYLARGSGLLLFHMEGEDAQRACFRGSDAERERYYAEQAASLRAGTFRRLHLNQRTTGESQFVDLALFDRLVDSDCRPWAPGDGRALYFGADAATKHDAVALVGCAYNDEKARVELAYVREWHPEQLERLAGGVDLEGTIGAELAALAAAGAVAEVRFDPYQFAVLANQLSAAGIRMVEMPQGAQRTEADQMLYDAITAGSLATFESPALRRAMVRAAGKETPRGYRLEKRPGDDLVVALSMAHAGARAQVGRWWIS